MCSRLPAPKRSTLRRSKQYKKSSRWCHSPYGEQWLDEQSFHTNTTQPFTDALGRELAPVITADVIRHTLADEQVTQPLENVLARQPLGNVDRQALPSKLVHDRQHSNRPSIGGTIGHEVVTPYMIATIRT